MNTEKKAFNWKKALTIFFTVVLILRALVWIFSDNTPSCTSQETKQKYAKLINRKMAQLDYSGLEVEVTNHKEVASSKGVKICEADVQFTNAAGESETYKGAYKIEEKDNKYTIKID